MADMTMKDRVRMALAEAGYPNAQITGPPDDPQVEMSGPGGVPDRETWQAFKVAGFTDQPCWVCWHMACKDGSCTATGSGVDDCGHDHERTYETTP